MGSSESTGRSNGGEKKEEDEPNRSGGTPNLGAKAVAIGATAVTIGAAVWGVSKLLSDNKLKDEMNTAFKSLGMDPGYSGGPSGPPTGYSKGSSESTGRSNGPSGPPSGYSGGPSGPPSGYSGGPSGPTSGYFGGPSGPTSPPRRFKLNTDGACHPNQKGSNLVQRGPSGYAGILEDDCGDWVHGFRGFIGVSDSLTAELYGVFKGLELLDKLGCMESVLESDCQAAVQWVTGEDDDRSGKSRIVRDCWDMIVKSRELVRKNNITIRLCSRDVNKDADKLAEVAIKKGDEYVEFTDVYGEINS